ncbi:MAG: CoB--CoM heterodisulfide reductase iron-sulfur subunit A family protein, partial [Gammaproteobacteria bacterium]|nr:CoB--CoM heterodisulfide reductase iron-sulfur subunit A family protein [Gammaproteobacteria bacterium]
MSEEKSACYICKGCGIGERLDAGQMSNIAKREGRMQIVKEHDFLCNAEGVKMIQDDIDNENVNKICIAACSRRAKTEAFSFEGVMMNRTNLREGVIWVRPDDEESKETTQEMADDYIRMGCADLKYMNMESGSGQQMRNDHILVVGGGVGGMTAAIEAAQAGYKATIVEKSGELGGWAAKLKSRTPSIAPYADPADTEIEAMKAAIDAFADVTVHLNATVAKTSGAPGRFSADIATESGSIVTENFGAIIQATGFDAYDASKLEQYSYGKNADIVDQAGLEALALAAGDGEIKRPSNGDAVKRVVFVQCAGQRSDKDGELSYCSGHCCSTSIKQAMYFKDQNPDIDTQIIHTDLRTPGSAGEDFYRSGQNKGVTFTKGIVSEVTADLKVKLKDLILDEEIEEQADLVVLATGQVPNSGINIDAIASDDDEEGSETETEESSHEIAGVSVLNLDYRQGPDMPQLRDGYADS